MPRIINGLSDVFGLYEGFILDLWGVVHDGAAPFPGTLPALTALKKSKRKVWLLSNAPRRCHAVVEKLSGMGIGEDLYDGILTSGEACHEALRDSLLAKWGRRCLHIGCPVRDSSLYEGLDIAPVRNPAEADFVLCSGVMDFSDPAEKYRPLLQDCARRQLPMLCANPDRVVHIENKLVICAGTLADMYQALDGTVTYFGKPYRGVYTHCLQKIGEGRVLAVGDSMRTDIAGATGAGLDSLLVTSGIHREELAGGSVEKFLRGYPYQPSYIVQSFGW